MRDQIKETIACIDVYLKALQMGLTYNMKGIVLKGPPEAAFSEAMSGLFSEIFRLRAQRLASSVDHARMLDYMAKEGWERVELGYTKDGLFISDIVLDKIEPEMIERMGVQSVMSEVLMPNATDFEGEEPPPEPRSVVPEPPDESTQLPPLEPNQCAICREGFIKDHKCSECETEFCETCSGVVRTITTTEELYDVSVIRPCRCGEKA